MADTLVEAIGVSRLYRANRNRIVRAVDHVDMKVGRGTTLGLVGESGSGKSTLGRTFVGLQTPSLGSVAFEGQDVAGASGSRLIRLRQQRQIVRDLVDLGGLCLRELDLRHGFFGHGPGVPSAARWQASFAGSWGLSWSRSRRCFTSGTARFLLFPR